MPDKDDLTSFVRLAQSGDDLAFAELVRRYQDMAVAYARSVLRNHHLAEEAVQEAFVEAHRELPSLREPAAFSGWFRTIIFKHCDRITRRKRHPEAALDAAIEAASKEPSPQDVLESRDAARHVWRAIDALSESDRQVLLLFYLGEHSHSAIAEFLGVTTNAVKTRLYSARKRLRKQMEQIEEQLKIERPSKDQVFARRVLSAALPLQIYFLDAFGQQHPAGSTVANRTAEAPDSASWLIEPRRTLTEKEWDAVIGLADEMKIPGIGAAGQMTDDLLERITRLDHLTWLSLQDSEQLTDTGLRRLSRLPRLKHLNLGCCHGITDAGLEVLKELPQLQTFKIFHQHNITDAGAVHLSSCECIERVDLMGTRTGDGAIKALTGKSVLCHFQAGTNITDSGLAFFSEFPAFKTWRGGAVQMSLMSARAHPTYLWLNLKSGITNAGISSLAGLDGLFAVNLFGTTGHSPFDDSKSAVTSAGLKAFAGLANLGWLGCCARLCDDEAMAIFGGMSNLRFLMCQDAVSGDRGFAALARSKSIEYIWGRRCYNLSGRGFTALAAMPALRGLSVSCKNVDDRELSALARFPVLDEFMPMDVPDAGFRHVGACAQLQALWCMYCRQTTDAATEHILGLSRLKTYYAGATQITDRSLELLSGIHSLEKLTFWNCSGITDAGLVALTSLPRLRQVDLENNLNLTSDGASVFPDFVQVNFST